MIPQNQYEAAKILRQIADEFGIYMTADGLSFRRITSADIEIDVDTDIVIHQKPMSNLSIDILQ